MPANQVGVNVAGSIWTSTSAMARPSLSSVAVVACSNECGHWETLTTDQSRSEQLT